MALLGNLKGSSQVFQDTEFYNGVILNSVRLNGSDTHFRRTLSEGGDRRQVTYSFWIKQTTFRKLFPKNTYHIRKLNFGFSQLCD